MKTLDLILLILLIAYVSGENRDFHPANKVYKKTECDPAKDFYYVANDNKCFKMVKKTATKEEAQTICEKENPHSHLVDIESEHEQKDLEIFLNKVQNNTRCAVSGYWSSGTRFDPLKTNQPFIWLQSDGALKPFSYTNWQVGYPNKKCQEECVGLNGKDYKWQNLPCSDSVKCKELSQLNFLRCVVCEIDMEDV